jgi:hypothetical protein
LQDFERREQRKHQDILMVKEPGDPTQKRLVRAVTLNRILVQFVVSGVSRRDHIGSRIFEFCHVRTSLRERIRPFSLGDRP